MTPLRAIAISTLLVTACGAPKVRPAPFRARPDSVEPGDLRGPFSGRVIDAGTGRPVTGAIVYSTWTLTRSRGLSEPAGYREHVTSTDATGRYRIPAVKNLPTGGAVRLTDFRMVVYKRGYVAYRSDRRFRDLGPRRDFAQRKLVINLERWRSDLSHVKHLRYVGGGAQLASLTAWEVEDAARELSGGAIADTDRRTTDPFVRGGRGGDVSAAVVATRLLKGDDVKIVTGFDGVFETGPLGDEPDSAEYSSVHLRAMDRAESFDVALRLWKLDPAEAQQRYGQLADTLPGAEERDEVGDRSLRASEGDIRGIAILDGRRGAVLLLTCGASQCRTTDEAVAIARRIYERLEDIWPTGGVE